MKSRSPGSAYNGAQAYLARPSDLIRRRREVAGADHAGPVPRRPSYLIAAVTRRRGDEGERQPASPALAAAGGERRAAAADGLQRPPGHAEERPRFALVVGWRRAETCRVHHRRRRRPSARLPRRIAKLRWLRDGVLPRHGRLRARPRSSGHCRPLRRQRTRRHRGPDEFSTDWPIARPDRSLRRRQGRSAFTESTSALVPVMTVAPNRRRSARPAAATTSRMAKPAPSPPRLVRSQPAMRNVASACCGASD